MIERYLTILATVTAIAILFAGVERLFPAERGQPARRWLFNLAYTPFALAFALAIGIAVAPVFARATGMTGGGILPGLGAAGSGPLSQVAFALAYAFSWDCMQYGLHRLQHRLPSLWATHRFHHDETALNATAQGRVHITSYALASLFHVPVLLLFGPRAPHFVAAFLMFTLWGFVNHANLRFGFGPLAPLLSSPQWHRIHHSRLPQHRDRNFAVLFPAIDMMFGTYWHPRRDEYPATGLDEPERPSLYAATIEPLAAWRSLLTGGWKA